MADRHEAFDGALEVRPPVGPEQLARVPAKRGVALLEAENARPIVLLTAADIRARVRTRLTEPLEDARRKAADLRGITRCVRWRLAAGHFETDLRFFELARTIWRRTYPSLVAWRPAWFVQVDPCEPFPHFQRTRQIAGARGRCFGPFAGSRQADRYIQILQEAFDLCRHVRCLRQAPHGARCAYAEMGGCLAVCDGTIGLPEYRRHVAGAADFAAGIRQPHLEQLKREMASAARELAFERAAEIKGRIERLTELDGAAFAEAAPLEAFRFVLIQPAAARRQVMVFFVNGGTIAELAPLRYPLESRQVAARLKAMARQAERPAALDIVGQWRLGLVSSYLFAGPARGGLMRRWSASLTEGELAAAIEAAAERLDLAGPKRGKAEPAPRTRGEAPGQPEGEGSR